MKQTIIILLILTSCFIGYKLGRSNGFDQGWNAGYIRGLENSQNYEGDN